MNFLINSLERSFRVDLNGDGYIGGEGLTSKLERWTGFDFNGDGIIGRPFDVPPNPSFYMPRSFYPYGGASQYPSGYSHSAWPSYY